MIGKGAIIFVLGFGVVFGIVSYQLQNLENKAITNMAYYHNVTNSHNLASAGANTAMSSFYQDTTLRGTIYSQTFTTGVFTGGTVTAEVQDVPNSRIRLRSLSQYKGFRDTVDVYFSKVKWNSFTMFAWMTNFEGNVFWITGDTVWGRVHSNGNLHMQGRPVFWEKVTTAKNINPKPGTGGNNAIFKKGYEKGIPSIGYPTDLSEIINASTNGGRMFTGNIWVELDPGTSSDNDGMAYIRTSATGSIIDSINLSNPSFNGALYSTGNISIKGTLDGKLTVSSGTNINIIDDVVYENITYTKDPLSTTSNDMLGLVANNNVIVADNTANNDNCEIHASIFVRNGSFYAENYSTRPLSGWLKIIGGIIQDTRGAVGTFNYGTTTIKTGFSKRYIYDARLGEGQFPPYFPGFYSMKPNIVAWWENVRIPEY